MKANKKPIITEELLMCYFTIDKTKAFGSAHIVSILKLSVIY